MKKVLLSVAAVAMMVTTLIAADVVSVNVVGYTKTELPSQKFIIRSMPFDGLTQDNLTLVDIFGTNQLTQASNYLNCDRIAMYDTASGTYKYFAQWTDGNFYLAGSPDEWNSYTVSNPVVKAGTAFWLMGSGLPGTNELTFLGEVVVASTQELALATGWQMVSYAFSSEMDIQDINTNGLASSGNYLNADRIVCWEGDHYQAHALYTDGVWYHANDADEWNLIITSTKKFAIGEGFWFVATEPKTWVEPNKYLNNL